MENTIKFAEHMAAMEQDMKSVHRRLDKLEDMTESVHTLATSVTSLATELKNMRKDVNSIDDRLESVEEKPKKKWEIFVAAVLSGLGGAAAGYILKTLGLF